MIVLYILIAMIVAIGLDVYWETNYPKVARVAFQTEKMAAGQSVQILQISDLHSKIFPNESQDFLQMIREQQADIIVLTGDLVDDSTREYGPVFSFVEELLKINKQVYYISGNHEWRQKKRDVIWAGLADRGVIMLNNANTLVKKGDLVFNLVGVDDPSTGHDDMATAFKGVNTEEKYTVLLAHAPDLIFDGKNVPADLILSGHAHGGQIRLPFVGGLVAPGQGFFPKYDQGIFPYKNNTTLYIDSGAGTSMWPIRFLCRSQITLLTIEGKAK